MKMLTFRFKVIVTLVTGITLFSVIAFTVYNISLKKKLIATSEQSIEQINLLRNQYYFTIRQHDGRIIRGMLKNMEKDKNVLGTYLLNGDSKVVYPDQHASLNTDTADFHKLFTQNKDISIKTYRSGGSYFNRVFIRMQNIPYCYSCHDPARKTLGMIILDLSNHETEHIMCYTWKFSVIYTILLLLSIFTLVAYMHYRYVRSSLSHFRTTIATINKGNLEARLTIPEANELGNLGRSFNDMLDTFEKTQVELHAYHRQEMENSQKLATIGEMSARIAHEIRNPITGIARAMEIIIADMKEDHNKPILEEIQRQANRVEQAISNLLKYSRAQEVRLHQGEVNEVIRSAVFFLKHQAYDTTVSFELDLEEDIPMASFDHELFENVLMNLSFNAIKATTENLVITYGTRYDRKENNIIISVCDNGTGIPDEVGDEIFKPFFTTHTKGTGLGLAISKDIIEKHRGRIWYENNAGRGCTFFISLPADSGIRLS